MRHNIDENLYVDSMHYQWNRAHGKQVKSNLLELRKALPADEKKKASLRYLRQWPFVHLARVGKDPLRPTLTQETVVASVLEFDPVFVPKETEVQPE